MNWDKIIFKISRPPGVTSWKYLKKRNTPIIEHHKKIYFYLPNRNKLLHFFLIIIQQLAWYFFFGWRAIKWVWERRSHWDKGIEKTTKKKQLTDLFYATFIYSIPPINYYQYQLYQVRRNNWLYFFFQHEIPKWHHVLSPIVSEESKLYLSSKKYFAEKSKSNKIPSIPTLNYFEKNSKFKKEDIQQKQSYFLKPNNANRSTGCMMLQYNRKNNNYQLFDLTNKSSYTDLITILKRINSNIIFYDYLIQPLLFNREDMKNIFHIDELITIRIISATLNDGVDIISAVLEIPVKSISGNYDLIQINTINGQLEANYLWENLQELSYEKQKRLKRIKGKLIPDWNNIKEVVFGAHKMCEDVKIVGWDVAITNMGVRIIEGNFGFSLRGHQEPKDKISNMNSINQFISDVGCLEK